MDPTRAEPQRGLVVSPDHEAYLVQLDLLGALRRGAAPPAREGKETKTALVAEILITERLEILWPRLTPSEQVHVRTQSHRAWPFQEPPMQAARPPLVTVLDNLSPEEVAMLQALYSRSALPVAVHLARMTAEKSGRFMSGHYVGYNHKSIADCGTTTMFIEGVSLLAAKAIQDWPLYSGQETSTRFIDMAQLDETVAVGKIVDPINTPVSRSIIDNWMDFYTRHQARVQDHVRTTHPMKADDDAKKYETAVKARGFDILRGFLPAGLTTQLSWHSNLRQAGDHLIGLAHHPSGEIRALARTLRGALGAKYPDSGFALNLPTVSGEAAAGRAVERAFWEEETAHAFSYLLPRYGTDGLRHNFYPADLARLKHGKIAEMLRTRPQGCVLPHFLSELGQITCVFHMDFGSFRDLQRHRNGVCRMPMLTTEHGFEPWYLDQLDADVRAEAEALVRHQTLAIEALDADAVDKQYLTALGFRVAGSVTYGLPAMVYILELRSGKTIHPTLRRFVLRTVAEFRQEFPVPIHADMDPDDWTVRRGGQTITRRDGGAL